MGQLLYNRAGKRIITFMLILLLATPIVAQQQRKQTVYVWDDFSKGLNTQISPFLMPKGMETEVMLTTESKSAVIIL